jgi:MFS family permease
LFIKKAKLLQTENGLFQGDFSPDELSPETGKPFSKAMTIRFLIAFTLYGILNSAAFGVNGTVLLPQHIKDAGIGNPTAAFATITSVTSVVSLFVGFVWGSLSDRTRSRWGRRTPWIFVGCIVSGIGLYFLGIMTTTISLTLAYCLNTLGNNAIQTPMYAFLADRCPQNIRGTLSAGFGASVVGAPIGTIIGSLFLGQTYQGMGFLVGAAIITVSGLIPLLILPKEPSSKHLELGEQQSISKILLNAVTPPKLAGAHDYYKACVGRFLMITSYQMIMQFQLYILESHIGLTVQQSASAIVTLSTITLVLSAIGTFASGPISDLIKQRKLPVLIASILFAIGTVFPWLMPTTLGMALYVGIAGLGYGIYMAVDQALNVDVLPNHKDSGKYIGFINLSTTLGLTLAPMTTSIIVVTTGSYASAFVVSIIGALVGACFIMAIKKVK